MAFSMYAASVPLIKALLGGLSGVIDKAAAFAAAKNVDPAVLAADRLAPDMFPLWRQVQIACDMARGGMLRLAGREVPTVADVAPSLDAMKALIAETLAVIDAIPEAEIAGSEDRKVVLKMRAGEMEFTGQRYLIGYVIPNFTFHCATAYNILRHNGVEIGKRDFLGSF
ncbi:MAG: DUF1993 domain-containing protein [Acetobacteraceae bacterium]|nr:DUF1993 domain-containing protein [Acetobacteraceae bacterium]